MSPTSDNEEDQRRYGGPYTSKHPIPTVQHYKEIKSHRQELGEKVTSSSTKPGAENKNVQEDSTQEAHETDQEDGSDVDEAVKDTSEALSSEKDPKAKRKSLKKRDDGDRVERVVTDPVTHLPIRIHDFTTDDMKNATDDSQFDHPEYARSPTSPSEQAKLSEEELKEHAARGQNVHGEMERLFPPPNFDVIKVQLARTHTVSLVAAIGVTLVFIGIPLLANKSTIPFLSKLTQGKYSDRGSPKIIEVFISYGAYFLSAASAAVSLWAIGTWNVKKVNDIWANSVWEGERQQGKRLGKSDAPESTHWFNGLMSSIWPLMNPDMFISLADTLEDVMQASLPKLVRMISVEDIGQGSEPFRILGVRWLPKGAAGRTVTEDGKVQKQDKKSKKTDRSVQGEGSVEAGNDNEQSGSNAKDEQQKKDDEEAKIAELEGMQAEEGEFVNLELALAFRARLSEHGLRSRSKNPHLYLAFYMPGNIKFPVWVELQGFIATVRLRLQLTPDPPFFSICTLTFLGQPKVDLSCVPLVKKGLNIMDLPVLSNFVQSAIDAAMAEYVAPKSLTLDLKNMIVGDDFKKDTVGRGVLVVNIKHAYDFKEGDVGVSIFSKGSTDGYVTVGWAKFGKPMWSSRVIQASMTPVWNETAYILVTPQELNVREKLRIQLWDSDRMSADDDLGRIEVDLNDIMNGEQSQGRMWDREDGFRSLKAGQDMPGKLAWSVGYYRKSQLLEEQLKQGEGDTDIKSIDDLKRKVYKESERKLREASKDESKEIEQQKKQDFKDKQDELVISVPPPKQYPSGILSIVIHQIQGLEIETLKKIDADKKETGSDEQEAGDDLPSSYCSIVLNHQKIYKTRTKPKNSMPFFNAGTERFVTDISRSHIHIAVRDARVHEDDPLIGVVDLSLQEVFEKRSQINGLWPLGGGIGYGQVRISLVFRSVEVQLPKELLGWDDGTIEMQPEITGEVPSELQSCKIKVKTDLGSRKFYADEEGNSWKSNKGELVHLAVKKRYSSSMVFQFRTKSGLRDHTPGFAILWLKDIPDDEDQTITLPVWKGDLERARNNVTEDVGDKIGQIQLKFKYWSGLSGYHLPLAKKDPNIADVMEILDCANDNNDDQELGDDVSSSDSSSDEEGDKDGPVSSIKKKLLGTNSDLSEDGKRGIKSGLQEYKQDHKQLHRRNRGLMQWKAPRTMKWMQGKITSGEQKVSKIFGHHGTGDKVETEV